MDSRDLGFCYRGQRQVGRRRPWAVRHGDGRYDCRAAGSGFHDASGVSRGDSPNAEHGYSDCPGDLSNQVEAADATVRVGGGLEHRAENEEVRALAFGVHRAHLGVHRPAYQHVRADQLPNVGDIQRGLAQLYTVSAGEHGDIYSVVDYQQRPALRHESKAARQSEQLERRHVLLSQLHHSNAAV